ncbi:MAG: restriction endonuclease, SacI family [Rhodospirillales bacterium]
MARVVDRAQTIRGYAVKAFQQVLTELARKSRDLAVEYLPPNRLPVEAVLDVIDQMLAKGSGGAAAQAIVAGLLSTVGRRFALWQEVVTHHVNVADSASEFPADVSCSTGGQIRLVCEVKDRRIKLDEIDQDLIKFRGKKIDEALFLVRDGVGGGEARDILRKHFASGIDGHVLDIKQFARPLLFLLGVNGRHEFLKETGSMLDKMKAPLPLRRSWAEILKGASP